MSNFNFKYSGSYRIIGSLSSDFDVEFTSSGWLEVTEGRMEIDAYLVGAGQSGGKCTNSYEVWGSGQYAREMNIIGSGSGGNGGGRLTVWGIILNRGDKKWIEIGQANRSNTTFSANGGSTSAFGYSSADGYASSGGAGGCNGVGGSSGENGGYAYWDSLEDKNAGTRPGKRFGAAGGGSGWNNWDNTNYGGSWGPGGAGGADGGGRGPNSSEAPHGQFGVRHGYNGTFFGAGGGAAGYANGNDICGLGYDGIAMIRNARLGGATYPLTINTDAGSIVKVERTQSNWGQNGTIEDGWPVYHDDILKITASPKKDFKIIGILVNGTSFESGRNYTVTGSTTIEVISQPLASDISATDANIGEACNIIITRYSDTYTHRLKYEFLGTRAPIINGNPPALSISWVIPISFLGLMPNSKREKCKIICETYEGSKLLGTSSVDIWVTVPEQRYRPSIVCSVRDKDPITTFLTGDDTRLVVGKSDIECSISATPQGSSSIKRLTIGKWEKTYSEPGTISMQISMPDYTGREVAMSATDSRGYVSSETLTPSAVVEYKSLSCYAKLEREAPTSGRIGLVVHGDYYNGSFGAKHNSLKLSFQYRENTPESMFSTWYDIPSTYIVTGVDSYQNSNSMPTISLNDIIGAGADFNYKKAYIFKIRAQDGVEGHVLSEIVASEGNAGSITVPRGTPIFDWGEGDFNFSVPVTINGISLLDMMYPIGSVYMSVNDSSPAVFMPDSVWEKIEDRFLLASGTKWANGSTGGEETHVLTEDEMPKHDHSINIGDPGVAGSGVKDTVSISNRVNKIASDHSVNTRGRGLAHNNMPPYLAVNVWKRVS